MSIDDQNIRDYINQVRASNALGRSKRRLALLEYILRSEASGEGEKLKAYSIGVDVFAKSGDFDPTTDSSVRVEIGRLRTAIALFEASEHATSALQVEIPVGSYRPQITMRGVSDVEASTPKSRRSKVPVGLLAMVCVGAVVWALIAGFDVLNEDDTETYSQPITLIVEDFSGDGLGKEISILVKDSFANSPVVRILDREVDGSKDGLFVVRGGVTPNNGFSWVRAELADRKTNQIVWNQFFQLKDGADFRSEIDSRLNGELETRLLGSAKVLLEKRDPFDLSPEQLFVLATWVSGPAENSLEWETERVRLMKIALEKAPDFGPAHSVLADKYGFLANVYPDWNTAESLELSRFHAAKAAELSPLDANVMFNVAQSYWHAGRHMESQRVFKRVTELNSGNSLARFFARVVPYWCDEVPDDVMSWALDFDNRLSRDDPIRWIVLTWIATLHTNRREYERALQAASDAAQIFQVGYTYMAHAMLLNKLGRPDEAAAIIRRQRRNWPKIGAAHYSDATIPRLCAEQAFPDRFIADYAELTRAMDGRLVEID